MIQRVKITQTFVTTKKFVSMVSFINKWLLLAFFPAIWAAGGETPAGKQVEAGLPHPFHVSVIEINHNAADKTLEISCKIFTDDFEKTLAKKYNTKVDLINPPNKAAMDTLIKKYLLSHLSIKANGKAVPLSYVGFENDHEAAFGYIQGDNVQAPAKVEISSVIMYDAFDDQSNIFHVIVNGKRKSTKLDYPNKEAVVSF